MTTTTYRCVACGKDVEVEVIDVPTAVNVTQVVEVKPCEVCLGVAEEGVKEESYDKGYQEGWQAGYDTMSEEEDVGPQEASLTDREEREKKENQCYRDDYAKGRQEGEAKSNSSEYGRGFDAGLMAGEREAEIENEADDS